MFYPVEDVEKNFIREVNKRAKFENIFSLYQIKKENLTSNLQGFICPFDGSKIALLFIDFDFNVAECKNCGGRFLPVNFVSRYEQIDCRVAALKLNFLLNLKINIPNPDYKKSVKYKEIIAYTISMMATSGNGVQHMSKEKYEEIYSHLVKIGISEDYIKKLELPKFIDRSFIVLKSQGDITDFLIYKSERQKVDSLYKKKYNKPYLCNKRIEFKAYEKHKD